MIPELTFSKTLNEFCNQASLQNYLTKGSVSSYKSYITSLDRANNNQTIDWIKEAISQSPDIQTFLNLIKHSFDSFCAKSPTAIPVQNRNKIKSAFVSFATFIYGYFNAEATFVWGGIINEMQLAQLVAQTAIFATPDTVQKVKNGKLGRKENKGKGNPFASWDCMTSIRDINNRGKTINNIYHDDNTRANQAIKYAIRDGLKWGKNFKLSYFKDFEACHIYDDVKNPKFYTSIMNIVLVPRALAALTDHNEYVKNVLKYRAWELFGFTGNQSVVQMPKNYSNIKWR
ncbi:MAG: hypothetical protein K2M07_06570 [Muribaculaceae bacterium]|nr:hypothetical protein [Muribaculaceae bacterium]